MRHAVSEAMATTAARATPERNHPLTPPSVSKVTPPFASDLGGPITPQAVSAVTATAWGDAPTCRPPPGAIWNTSA